MYVSGRDYMSSHDGSKGGPYLCVSATRSTIFNVSTNLTHESLCVCQIISEKLCRHVQKLNERLIFVLTLERSVLLPDRWVPGKVRLLSSSTSMPNNLCAPTILLSWPCVSTVLSCCELVRKEVSPPQGASGGRARGFPGQLAEKKLRSRRRTPRNIRAPGARLTSRASSTD